MSDPTFASPERRSLLLPVALALIALAVLAAVTIRFFPPTSVNVHIVRTDILPTTTLYKADSIVVGQNETVSTLFVASTLRVENGMRFPVFIEGTSLTLTDNSGAELTEKGLGKQDIASVEQSFPRLRPLLAAPLLQNAAIDPGSSAQGTALFSLSIPQSLWNTRKSAIVKVDLYHQPSVFVTLPRP